MPGGGGAATAGAAAAAAAAGGGGGRRKIEVFGIPLEHYAFILAGAFVANQLFKFGTGMWDIVAEVRHEHKLEASEGEAEAAGEDGSPMMLYDKSGRLSLLVSVFVTSIVSVVFYKLLCKKPANVRVAVGKTQLRGREGADAAR
eukprot:INCI4828.1.p6 GENE.INCI4828.1~~INCI4828.1.p6  ORF type:complete len:144 (+),score=34.92 INCI4828.1:145-576(+)